MAMRGRQTADNRATSRGAGRALARRIFALLCALACSIGSAAPAGAVTAPDGPEVVIASASPQGGDTQVVTVSASTQVGDMQELVHVLVAPQPGTDPRVSAQAGFAAAGVTPTDQFTTGVAVWPQFFARDADDATVVQSYNPAGDPTGGAGLAAIQAAERAWSSVPGSRFRYQFGGLTTRCPATFQQCSGGFHLSGHNDAGWLDLGNSGLLGVTISTFRIGFGPSGGDLIEADTALNSNPAVHWATDGSGWDVQSAFTHEDGHAAGLGHSPNPAAVMFAFLASGQIKRTLTLQDTTAIRFLYPIRPLQLVTQPDQRGLHRLALLGTGSFVGAFQPGALNDRGEAAFVAGVNTGGQGVFLATTAAVVEIARTGSTADGLTLGAGGIGPAGFDRDGNVVFAFKVGPDPGPNAAPGQGAALFLYNRTERKLHALVRPGVTPAPGGGVFEGAIASRMDHGSTIAFTGVIDTPAGMDYGVFTASTNGPIALVARPGQTVSGGTAVSPQAVSVNERGDVAFVAFLVGDAGFSAFVRRVESGNIQLVARSGAPAPGGGSLNDVLGPRITDDGGVLFAADLADPSAQTPSIGLFLASRERMVPIARPGDLMPGGAHLVTLGRSPSGWSSGGDGQVAFVATVDSHIGAGGSSDTAIYTWSRGDLRTVIRSGNVIADIGPIGPRNALMNSRGQLLFASTPPFSFFPGSLLLIDSRSEQ